MDCCVYAVVFLQVAYKINKEFTADEYWTLNVWMYSEPSSSRLLWCIPVCLFVSEQLSGQNYSSPIVTKLYHNVFLRQE